ncbi:MAG TPA: D-alanyl-D-alanine carboxypeptidase family protein [Humibacter sp.]|nr:D-alanyl-D-alanine carboxypeptidase family protein [Humibacter sp.]
MGRGRHAASQTPRAGMLRHATALGLALATAAVIAGCSSSAVPPGGPSTTTRSSALTGGESTPAATGTRVSQAASPEPGRTHPEDHGPTGVQPPQEGVPAPTGTAVPPGATDPAFDSSAHSIVDPASIWVVVNKSRALSPLGYVPQHLVLPDVPNVNGQPMRSEVAAAITVMFSAGRKAGLGFSVQSAYRSYRTQVAVYDEDVTEHGRAFADTDTARPGHSEHQTGLAVDISAVPADCSLAACFGTTRQGEWLAANAWRFGFLLRYPADKVAVTGFTYEPWHFRYVGTALAAEMRRRHVTTLEEFFGVPGGTTYR